MPTATTGDEAGPNVGPGPNAFAGRAEHPLIDRRALSSSFPCFPKVHEAHSHPVVAERIICERASDAHLRSRLIEQNVCLDRTPALIKPEAVRAFMVELHPDGTVTPLRSPVVALESCWPGPVVQVDVRVGRHGAWRDSLAGLEPSACAWHHPNIALARHASDGSR